MGITEDRGGRPQKILRINVTATPGTPDSIDNIQFALSEDPGSEFKALRPDGTIDLRRSKFHDVALIKFTIDDRTSHQLQFPHSPEEGFWVNHGDVCPKDDPGNGGDVCRAISVSNGRMTLNVRDDNERQEKLTYALVMTTNKPGQRAKYDPVIENQGVKMS